MQAFYEKNLKEMLFFCFLWLSARHQLLKHIIIYRRPREETTGISAQAAGCLLYPPCPCGSHHTTGRNPSVFQTRCSSLFERRHVAIPCKGHRSATASSAAGGRHTCGTAVAVQRVWRTADDEPCACIVREKGCRGRYFQSVRRQEDEIRAAAWCDGPDSL